MKILLIAVAVIGMSAVLGAVIVGLEVFDGTVLEHPYERGIAWDDERFRRESSGLETAVEPRPYRKGPNDLVFRVVGREGKPVGHDRVGIRISRLETSEHRREYEAEKRGDGSFVSTVYLPLGGRWDVTVIVEGDDGPIEFPHEIYAGLPLERTEEAAAECVIDAGSCVKGDGAGTTVFMDIIPRPVRTMEEVEFKVKLVGKDGPVRDGHVTVDLTMPGMYMGVNSISLSHEGEGLYSGRGVIVRCPSGRKTWKAVVSSASIYAVDFVFLVDQ